MPYAIVVHGGAGRWRVSDPLPVLVGVRKAAAAGLAILNHGGQALDAVIQAVVALEDDPLFNAGTGSVLNEDGEVEMDAGVMVGHALRTGNVAGLGHVKNPVRVARKVMDTTDHVLLAGAGALKFARDCGFAVHNPVTPERRAAWQQARAALREGNPRRGDAPPDTVGAVALDRQGRLAVAASTGGLFLKRAGRIGDTPVPGAGHYATPRAVATATGPGEIMLRHLTAKGVCDHIGQGRPVQQAIDGVLAEMGDQVGLIALDSHGNIGIGHGTPAMPHAFASHAVADIRAAMSIRALMP